MGPQKPKAKGAMQLYCSLPIGLPDRKVLTFESLQATAKEMADRFVEQGVVMLRTKNFFIKKLTLQPVISVCISTMLL